jgi:hypothetical protein
MHRVQKCSLVHDLESHKQVLFVIYTWLSNSYGLVRPNGMQKLAFLQYIVQQQGLMVLCYLASALHEKHI